MDYNQAADTLKRLARDREAMQFAADAFTALGSIDQATAEANRACEMARANLAEVQGKVSAANADLADVELRAKSIVTKAERVAAEHIEAAVQRIQEAERSCAERIDKNTAEAKQQSARKIAEQDHQLQVVMATVGELRAEEKALKDSIAARAVELASLEGRIKAAREAVQALLA